jgi:hypothetical protein
MKPLLVPLCSALALASAFATPPALALGRLVDLQVIDRDSGAALPVYRHLGHWWVAGRPGTRYALQLRNTGPGRVLGVMAVDGVNVISGDTASWAQTGYVLTRRQTAQITGWRKSDDEVAVFRFTALPQSYAARTGRPEHVGVIGVAVFRERAVRPPRTPPSSRRDNDLGEASASHRAEAAGAHAPPAAEVMGPQAGRAARPHGPASPQLGTAHGERESSHSHATTFERRNPWPDEVITVRYDSHDNLVALGVIPPMPAGPRQPPSAFPHAPGARYVPDPPLWP